MLCRQGDRVKLKHRLAALQYRDRAAHRAPIVYYRERPFSSRVVRRFTRGAWATETLNVGTLERWNVERWNERVAQGVMALLQGADTAAFVRVFHADSDVGHGCFLATNYTN